MHGHFAGALAFYESVRVVNFRPKEESKNLWHAF